VKDFWQFARRMLHYKGLVVASFVFAGIDALCFFGGLSALMWAIKQLFGEQQTIRELAAERLADPALQRYAGDLTHLVEYIPAGRFDGFAALVGVTFVIAVIGSIARFGQQTCVIGVSLRTIMRVRQAAFHRLIHAPMPLVMTRGTADNMSRVVRDTGQLVRGLNAVLGKAVRDILQGIAAFFVALCFDPKLTLFFIVALPPIFILVVVFGKKMRKAARRAMKAYGGMIEAMSESLRGIRVVKTHTAEGYERRRFNTINRRVFHQEMRARTLRALASPLIELIGMAGVIGVAMVAAYWAFETEAIASGDVVPVLMALGMAAMAMKPLANLNNDLQEASAAAIRLNEVIHLPVEDNTRRRGPRAVVRPDLPRHAASVRFEGVDYAYPGSNEGAVSGVTLEVGHGEHVAVVGPNGSGKTTLLSMLPRLLDPDAGRVLIDGQDTAEVSLRSLRRQMAVVTQDTVLFAGTIADNIAYGRRHTPRGDIEAAARAAYADEFIRGLPNGYDTVLGEDGVGLSGGQRQRLCIARAILRDPAILILDEATSQIDADSEAKINLALRGFFEGRTTFVIAHRLSTVRDADRIVVMADGRIVDQGRHDALLARCSVYQVLTQTQLGGQPVSAV